VAVVSAMAAAVVAVSFPMASGEVMELRPVASGDGASGDERRRRLGFVTPGDGADDTSQSPPYSPPHYSTLPAACVEVRTAPRSAAALASPAHTELSGSGVV